MLALAAEADEAQRYWPQWRGPLGTGVAPEGNPPVEWSETKNLRFKVEIPGVGHASPIVWKDRIYLMTAVAAKQQKAEPEPAEGDRRSRGIQPTHTQRFVLLALDRATGEVVWERTAREALPHESTHLDGTWASASPITDGERIFAHFGSNGLYAYDLAGTLLWSKDLGEMQTRNGFGEGSSPALHGDTLVVNWDHEGDSFIVALDKRTGKELWRRQRPGEVTSWSTPLVVGKGPRPQVVVAATGKTRGYDLESGDVLWESGGMTVNTIPSPVEKDGTVYVMSGFRGNALQAIRLEGARGDLAGTPHITWSFDRDTPYVPSPLLY
ncbi:MAG: PQQ-like beta-propeller repeat protein, partial [Acidobacteria bacterium]|nr:PQQ-like beta-propeller repeat protein [Acidobacteriota bacterium]